jgi:hypothetical protein
MEKEGGYTAPGIEGLWQLKKDTVEGEGYS